MKFPRLAFAIWDDATADAEWKPYSASGVDRCYAHGFITAEEPDYISFSAAIGATGDVSNAVITIPRGMIKKLIYFPDNTLSSLLDNDSEDQ